MSDPDPPPPEPVRELPQFYRLGPWMLIFGSFVVTLGLGILTSALRWSDFLLGLKVSAFMFALLAIPLFVVLAAVQGILSAIVMSRRRRAAWRTWVVLAPALLIVALSLVDIASLFPPERRARRELAQHLGGAVPDSVRDVTLDYSGGIDPGWAFRFRITPGDFEKVRGYRAYHEQGGRLQHHSEPDSQFYYLDYDPATGRCEFQSQDY